jgi:glutamine synthetase
MNTNVREILALAKSEQVTAIDLQFTNLFGGWHHLTLPASQLTEKIFESGIPFDGSSIPGFKSLEAGDMILIPDASTALWDPFWSSKTLSFISFVRDAGTGASFPRDPRGIAGRAEEALRASGIADRSLWAPEFEFYIFDQVSYQNDVNLASYRIDSAEADWNSAQDMRGNLGYKIPRKSGYHASPPLDQLYDLRAKMVQRLEEAKIPVRYHHHEVGGPGQSEIEILPGSMPWVADAGQRAKYIIKMTAFEAGKSVTFMPKPLFNEAGSGMHFHQTLWKGDRNLFYDEKGYAGLSSVARSYIAGVLHHGPALLAITNPSTNSYKRLVPGFEAPVRLLYGLANRSAAIRIPKYATSHDEKRIEFRPSDASCNIYLAIAAQLLAGLDGVRRKLDPSELGMGPIDQDVSKMSLEEREKYRILPTSLREACLALQEDYEFLMRDGVFPSEFVDIWTRQKLDKEYDEVRRRPHPYEIGLYYDV